VAKLRLTDEEKKYRQGAQRQLALQRGRGQMNFSDALEIYRARLAANTEVKSKTKHYYTQRIESLLRTWPGLEKTNVRDISKQSCLDWAAKYKGSATAFNNTALVLRMVLDIAMESGVIYENAARHIARRAIKPKELHLPDNAKFVEMVQMIENAGGRFSRDCANLVRFLAYGGFRLGEAGNITWADCNFKKEEIVVRGDSEEGTKNSEIRRVPMIAEMCQLLERLRETRSEELPAARVMRVGECQKAMEAAVKKLGISHLTHHDLRHLFATRCIESGVDIPTVSRWLGHKDGGGLAMKVYGHLRNQHSTSMAKLVSFAPVPNVPNHQTKAE
jgi:integrase